MFMMKLKKTIPAHLICLLLLLSAFAAAPVLAQDEIDTGYVSWSPDGALIAFATGKAVEIHDAKTLRLLNTIPLSKQALNEAVWSPDGKKLAVPNGADLEIWQDAAHPDSAKKLLTYQYYADDNPPRPQGKLHELIWSPNGKQIAMGLGEFVEIVQTDSGKRLRRFHGGEFIWTLAWSSDNRLAVGGDYSFVRIFDPNTGTHLTTEEKIKN
jgi:WD40 repeat protein